MYVCGVDPRSDSREDRGAFSDFELRSMQQRASDMKIGRLPAVTGFSDFRVRSMHSASFVCGSYGPGGRLEKFHAAALGGSIYNSYLHQRVGATRTSTGSTRPLRLPCAAPAITIDRHMATQMHT